MTPLLVITGVLLVVSGTVKVRASERAKLGIPLLSLLEVLAGILVSAMAILAPPSVEAGFGFVLGSVVLVVVSSVTMANQLASVRKKRDESEGSRLVTYVKYLSKQQDSDG